MSKQGIADLDIQAIEGEVSRLPEVVACVASSTKPNATDGAIRYYASVKLLIS